LETDFSPGNIASFSFEAIQSNEVSANT
jgi:hypothetical protein